MFGFKNVVPFVKKTSSSVDTRSLKRALVLLNPHSRNGGGDGLCKALEVLRAANIHLLRVETRDPEHLISQIYQHRGRVNQVIVAGGDGTISAAAKAVYDLGLPLGILPMGTANDFARSLGIPADPVAAADIIAQGQTRRINLGSVNGHYFFNVANIGLGPEVTHHLTGDLKKRWGVMSYAAALVEALRRKRSFAVSINVDGKRFATRSLQLAIGNGRFYGGGNVVDESSTIADGKLALYCIKSAKIINLLVLLPLWRLGLWRHGGERVIVESGKTISIDTRKPKEVHADGEAVCYTPAEFRVIEKAIEVYASQIVGEKSKPAHACEQEQKIANYETPTV